MAEDELRRSIDRELKGGAEIMRYRVPSEKGGWHDRRSRELSKKTFLSREEKDQVITLR